LGEFLLRANTQVEAHATGFERPARLQRTLHCDDAVAIPMIEGTRADISQAAWGWNLAHAGGAAEHRNSKVDELKPLRVVEGPAGNRSDDA
jgi:hypothetical protein